MSKAKILASAAAIAFGAVFLSAPAFAATVVPATQDLGNLNPPDASDFDAAVLGDWVVYGRGHVRTDDDRGHLGVCDNCG